MLLMLWKFGTYLPTANSFSWTNLANILWVEETFGEGFSRGVPNINSQEELAEQLVGFLEIFTRTFGLQRKKIWINGESYAGRYVPYICDALFARQDKEMLMSEG